jgi:hypothetical protein
MADTPSGYGPPDAQPPRPDETPEPGHRPPGEAGEASRRRGEASRPELSPPSGDPAPGAVPSGSRSDDECTVQTAFEDLMSRFDEEPAERRWPAAEDLAEPHRAPMIIIRPALRPPEHADRADEDDAPGYAAALDPPGGTDQAGDLADDGDGDEGHYEPPPPPPVPRMRPVTRWALGSIALGVAILVVPALIGLDRARSHDVAGVFLILGGVGTLLARMGERPPTDSDGPDDGAAV